MVAVRLHLTICPAEDTDAQELSELGQQLRTELLNSEADTIEPVRADIAPPGAKGDPVTLGAIAITIVPIAIEGLIKIVQSWLSRHDHASVTVESEGEKLIVTGEPSPEQRQMINAFLSRHRR